MTATHFSPPTILYDQDYQLWLETTIAQLRRKDFNQVDWEILLEELESLVSSNRREIENRLIVLIMHLLKYQFQSEKRSSSWVKTILEQRRQIASLLKSSPSLKPYYQEIFADCYLEAIRDAAAETKLPMQTFPAVSPFLSEDVINADFILALVNQDVN